MITLRYSEEFASEMRTKVDKPGVKMFLIEALSDFEVDLEQRPERFLRHLQENGRGLMIALEKYGKVQITRGENRKSAPRYFIRFMNAPEYILVATCDATKEFYSMGVVPHLSFTAVVSLSAELSRLTQASQPRVDGRM